MGVEVFYPHVLSNWPLVPGSDLFRNSKRLLGFLPSFCPKYLLCIQGLTMDRV
jgi:hypothetical protein